MIKVYYDIIQVAIKICKYYDMISAGKTAEVESDIVSSRKAADVGSSQAQPGVSDDEDADEDMDMVRTLMCRSYCLNILRDNSLMRLFGICIQMSCTILHTESHAKQ